MSVKLPNSVGKARQRIAGDGTSWITEYAAMAAGLSGYLCGMYLWFQWGKQQGLSDLGFAAELFLSQVVLLIETAFHELGHVLGLSHVSNNDRLMTGLGTFNITNPPPDLIASEINTMVGSGLSTPL